MGTVSVNVVADGNDNVSGDRANPEPLPVDDTPQTLFPALYDQPCWVMGRDTIDSVQPCTIPGGNSWILSGLGRLKIHHSFYALHHVCI